MNIFPVNLSALLVELDDLPQTLGLFEQLDSSPIEGITAIIPAARTLLVHFDPGRISARTLAAALRRYPLTGHRREHGELVEIPVYYNGEDLAEVAQLLELTTDEVIRRHCATEYQVAFCGFAPGFAYLTGDAGLEVPRRPTPRTRIPAGAVGLAGPFSGIYPTDSPGGWQLIGVTPLTMWDVNREPAALLQPGMRVRFTPLDEQPTRPAATAAADTAPSHRGAPPTLEVLQPGLQSLFQDLGRTGQTHQGVSAAGAMDRAAFRAANRLVGNHSDATALEIAQGGLTLYCHRPTVVGVTGAKLSLTRQPAEGAAHQVPGWQPIELAAGDTLTLGAVTAGVRSYLALRGGFEVTPVLGSCATDTLARLGPAPLAGGDRLYTAGLPVSAVALHEAPAFELPSPGDTVTLDILMGPRSDWFTEPALERLCQQVWQVTPQSDRVGLRLAGEAALERSDTSELPSEGTVSGALQVPPSGQPVLFLADHPLTGGYPVIACVADHHLDLAGQIPAGARIRFNPISAFAPCADDSRETTEGAA
ncbi:KipI family sensor histidine kinase inhibitor [Kushneria sinocarnis]|uniref:KipI family sensor histidine kinase inhibitor n=1 Tax=Kushneria sinocarnis TaxID=595502 RepID=A0A420WWE3_9GAMM|nr:urea amidolyase family protein [Kushneria sinocarnis]RKR03435.1 KipI family sensor histidine kinase inhibitor [Kushneria sinocarnis]